MPHMEMSRGLQGIALICAELDGGPRKITHIRQVLVNAGFKSHEISDIFDVVRDRLRLVHVRRGTDSVTWELFRREFKVDNFR